jgi:hypothetical protein
LSFLKSFGTHSFSCSKFKVFETGEGGLSGVRGYYIGSPGRIFEKMLIKCKLVALAIWSKKHMPYKTFGKNLASF